MKKKQVEDNEVETIILRKKASNSNPKYHNEFTIHHLSHTGKNTW